MGACTGGGASQVPLLRLQIVHQRRTLIHLSKWGLSGSVVQRYYPLDVVSNGGVWIFNDGITQLVEDPLAVPMNENNTTGVKGKVLVHLVTNQEVTSYEILNQKLREAGWTRFWDGDDSLRQYHKSDCCNDLISLPKSFAYMKSMHMYDIVVKNPHTFRVRDK